MLECSLGKIDSAVVRKMLSGFQFCELAVPMDSYSDAPTFTLTLDGVKTEYKMVGSEVYMHPGEKTAVKVSAIRSDMEKWLEANPLSVDSAEAADILKGLGIENGPKIPITLLNLFLNKGQLAIVLANMSPKSALIDFDSKKVVYYSDIYKQKPIQVPVPFRRIIARPPIAGYIGWSELVSGVFPDDTQAVMSFGQFTNIDQTTMENVLNNCNEIAKMFSDMQIFTWNTEVALGATVVSGLTYDKKVVVAVEEHWDVNDNLMAVYHCI